MLCDSNILIYAADPADSCCLPFVVGNDAVIASVTGIEVLGFPGWENLSDDRRIRLNEIVWSLPQLQLDAPVIEAGDDLAAKKEDESR